MPKGSRKAKPHTKRQVSEHYSQADFTVNDFANAEPAVTKSGRMSKALLNAFSVHAKQLVGQKDVSAEVLTWYEQAESDKEACDTESDHEDAPMKDAADSGTRRRSRRRRKFLQPAAENSHGEVYPIDLWVVIGDWIHPEDVLLFASICHGSHVVTHTARFWYSLYRRCYSVSTNLPPALQQSAMDQLHGLRARVIRSLFIMYEPFQQRLQARVSFDKDPECLKGAQCTLIWYQNVKSYWHFFFKFTYHVYSGHRCPLAGDNDKQNGYRQDANIHYNPDYGSCVLQVVTQNFIPIPPLVMGQVLAKTALSVGHGMRYHKMKLIFTPQQYTSVNNALHSGTTVVMDPVLNAYILNWWDPKYPHQST